MIERGIGWRRLSEAEMDNVEFKNRRYVVPEGGIEAACRRVHRRAAITVAELRVALEAFIAWQAENAPVPTLKQTEEMFRRHQGEWDRMWKEWRGRMYAAPEPEPEVSDKEARIRQEAWKRVLDEIAALSKGEEIEGGIGADVKGAFFLAVQRFNRKAASEPQSLRWPEEVKDLLWDPREHSTKWPRDHNSEVLEAYNRGLGHSRQAQKS